MVKKLLRVFARVYKKIFGKEILKSPFLSSIYYTLDSSFKREHLSVLNGIQEYERVSKLQQKSITFLTRSIHRIEKGLIMRNRKKNFGESYIRTTVNNFKNIYNDETLRERYCDQIKWYKDNLFEYFEANEIGNKAIDESREIFIAMFRNEENNVEVCSPSKSIPYMRRDSVDINISYEEFYKLTRRRRSVRWFDDKKVPREVIDKAIMAAIQSPSACNRQPFEYHIFDDIDLLKKVVSLPMGTKGFENNIPVVIVSVGNLDAYSSERDRHAIYVDASLANMALMFALETLGLASCSINWPDIEHLEKKMSSILKLKPWQRPVMCIAVGYADPEGKIPFSEKKPIDHLRKYNYE